MNVREALVEAIRECDVVGNVVMENGRMFVDVSIDKVANDLAPIIERALRAAYWAGEAEHRLSGDLYKLAKEAGHANVSPFSDRGVTAGVAAMVEEK